MTKNERTAESVATRERRWRRRSETSGRRDAAQPAPNRFQRARLLTDVVTWVAAVPVALVLRHGGDVDWSPRHFVFVLPLALGLHVLIGAALGLYHRRWREGSFDELLAVAVAVLGATALLSFAALATRGTTWSLHIGSAALVAGFLALVVATGARVARRIALRRRKVAPASSTRVLVYGAGSAGHQMIESMMDTPEAGLVPVALLDDDPRKRNMRFGKVRVVGGRRDLHAAAREFDADLLLIAVPSAGSDQVRELSRHAISVGLDVKVLPTLEEIIDGHVDVDDIRLPTHEDLLGRRKVEIDLEAASAYLRDQVVLVTGAGGSIGSELVRQISRFSPKRLIMVDRDESALHAVQLSLDGQARLESRDLQVADIRDRQRMFEVFDEVEPAVVFHAAALKHVPLLELHPSEGFKTNVAGTRNVLDAAERAGVTRFINVSTDKAADPASVLGYTKRLAEQLTATKASTHPQFISTRFGNVLGSRGSMLGVFEEQVASGGPITVTHPEVARYFMTVEEAVSLLIQAGAIGTGGEVMVLDMGEPVRIDDVARQIANQAPYPVEVIYTGLRPGEKLLEVLTGPFEHPLPSSHQMLTRVEVPAMAWEDMVWLLELRGAEVRQQLPVVCSGSIDLRDAIDVPSL